MTSAAPPKWLDDSFSVLPTNFVVAANPAQLTPGAGVTASLSAPPITVQKSGNFLILVAANVHTVGAAAGHNVDLTVLGTDSFASPYVPLKQFAADQFGVYRATLTSMNLDQSGLARGATVTYTANVVPLNGADTLRVDAGSLSIIVVEL